MIQREGETRGLEVVNLAVAPLRPVSFTVARGECIGIAGASGGGKSRLLRAIADIVPAEGRVALDGVDRNAMPAPQWRRQVMLLPSETQWWAERVIDHFAERPTAEELQALGLAGIDLNADPGVASSGERQRLALLRALSRRPSVLLLDEPTSNLDDANAARVEAVLMRRRAAGLALVWVSHDGDQLRRVAHRTLRLADGALAAA